MTVKKQFKWHWAWQDEQEEAWLREMAQRGWHLQEVGFPCRYVFQQGPPRDDVYRLDFFTQSKDKASYLQLFQDAGWEHVGAYGSWQYFRKGALDGVAPEIFTDDESKIAKYQRIMLLLVVLFPAWSVGITRLGDRPELLFQILTFVGVLLMLLYVYAMVMLLRRISQLKRK